MCYQNYILMMSQLSEYGKYKIIRVVMVTYLDDFRENNCHCASDCKSNLFSSSFFLSPLFLSLSFPSFLPCLFICLFCSFGTSACVWPMLLCWENWNHESFIFVEDTENKHRDKQRGPGVKHCVLVTSTDEVWRLAEVPSIA